MSGKNTHKSLLCSVCRNRRCGDGHCWLVSSLLQTRLPQGTLHSFCMRNLVRDWTLHGYWGNNSTCFSLVPSKEICALLRLLVAFVRTHPNLGVPVVQSHKFSRYSGRLPINRPHWFYQGHLGLETGLLSTRFLFCYWQTRIRNQWSSLVKRIRYHKSVIENSKKLSNRKDFFPAQIKFKMKLNFRWSK